MIDHIDKKKNKKHMETRCVRGKQEIDDDPVYDAYITVRSTINARAHGSRCPLHCK
jgi:hypothetical protein